jgi:hypothetical protein
MRLQVAYLSGDFVPDKKPNVADIRSALLSRLGEFDSISIKYAIDKDLHIEDDTMKAIAETGRNLGFSVDVVVKVLQLFWSQVESLLENKEYLIQEMETQHPNIKNIEGFDIYLTRTLQRIYNKLYDFVWDEGWTQYRNIKEVIKKN